MTAVNNNFIESKKQMNFVLGLLLTIPTAYQPLSVSLILYVCIYLLCMIIWRGLEFVSANFGRCCYSNHLVG